MKVDKTKPLFVWSVDGIYGKELIIALRTKPCTYGQCTFCDLPSLPEVTSVAGFQLKAQIDYVIEYYSKQLETVSVVSIYCAGSVFDTVPFEVLDYLMSKLNTYTNIKMLSMENRHELITSSNLNSIRNITRDDIQIEMAVGFEAYDSVIRNEVFKKSIELYDLKQNAKLLAEFEMNLKVYGILGIKDVKPKAMVHDVERMIAMLMTYKLEYMLKIRFHLNPAYIPHQAAAEILQVPSIYQIAECASFASKAELPMYIGINTEDLDSIHYTETEVLAIIEYNKTNNPDVFNGWL